MYGGAHTCRVVSLPIDGLTFVAASGLVPVPHGASVAELVPVTQQTEEASSRALAPKWWTLLSNKGPDVGIRVTSLATGLFAGTECLDEAKSLGNGEIRGNQRDRRSRSDTEVGIPRSPYRRSGAGTSRTR